MHVPCSSLGHFSKTILGVAAAEVAVVVDVVVVVGGGDGYVCPEKACQLVLRSGRRRCAEDRRVAHCYNFC